MCPSNRAVGGLRWQEAEVGLQQVFQMLDVDGDGAIDWHDLSAFFSGCAGQNLSREEATSMIAMADADGDGRVRVDDFERLLAGQCSITAWLEKQRKEAETAALRRAFEVLDVDKDGQVGRADLRSSMSMFGHHLSNEDVDAMLHAGAPSSLFALDFDAFSALVAHI